MIAINTIFVLFGLASGFTGTIAWFLSSRTVEHSSGDFAVARCDDNSEIVSIELIKFDYHSTIYNEGELDEFTVIDYITPETGSVNRYTYNSDESSFGFFDAEVWKSVSIMNTYDPIEMIISGNGLFDLNCNAIYEIVVESEGMTDAYINATISKILGKEKEDDDLFFTTCTNFDIFFEDDAALSLDLYYQWNSSSRRWRVTYDEPDTGNPSGTCTNASDLPASPSGGDYYLVTNHDTQAYYPSYIDPTEPEYYTWNAGQSKWVIGSPGSTDKGTVDFVDELPEDPENGDYYLVNSPLKRDEDLYYRLSFLSSAKSSHAHFYGSASNEVDLIRRGEVGFSEDRVKFYINVNYAPDQLTGYSRDIYKRNYTAVYDFFFTFSFTRREAD